MAETPRTQVEEPRFGVSIQPAADPVDRTIIARAPSITPDPYMNAWSEIARDFASAYGGIKKAQVEADIPMGEQYYLESGIDGLFEDGKDQLVAMAKLTQNQQVAEEHSVGTRIGFERAAGRSAANRERSKITAVLTDMLAGSGGLDEYGLPKMPTAQDIEQAVAKVRAENYSVFKNKPEYAWFYNSPYATEEYNKVIRSVVPEITESFKQKAREQMTENKRAMVAEDLTNKIVSGFEALENMRAAGAGPEEIAEATSKLYDLWGGEISNNVVAAAIPDPRKFVAETFKAAGLVILQKNPSANATKLMESFNSVVDNYSYKGSKLTGLYSLKVKDDLSTQARQQDSQRINDRQRQIKSRAAKDQSEYTKDTSLSYLINESLKNLTPDKNEVEEIFKARDAWIQRIMADPTSEANGDRAFAIEVANEIVAPYIETAQLGIKRDNSADKAATEYALRILMNPKDPTLNPDPNIDPYSRAVKHIQDSVRVPSNKLEALGLLRRFQDAQVPNLVRTDPSIKAEYSRFEKTKKPPTVSFADLERANEGPASRGADFRGNVAADGRVAIRSSISNQKRIKEYGEEFDADNQRLLDKIAGIQSDTTKTPAQKSAEVKTVIADAYNDRERDGAFIARTQAQLELTLRGNETVFIDSGAAIESAFQLGTIDAPSRNKLIAENKKYMEAALPSRAAIKQAVTRAYTEAYRVRGDTDKDWWDARITFPAAPPGVPAVSTPPQITITGEGKMEIEAITDALVRDYTMFMTSEGSREGIKIRYGNLVPETRPASIQTAVGPTLVLNRVGQMANSLIQQRRAVKAAVNDRQFLEER